MLKRFLFGIVLLGLLTLTAAWSADTPYKLYRFYSITESYTFSLTQWEAQNLFGKCLYHAREHHQRHELSREQEIEIVEEYFGLGHAEAVLESEMRQSKDAPGDGDSKTRRLMEKQLQSVRERRHALEGKTEEIISKQISQILTQQGLASKHWRAFPPVEFKMDELPHLLIISPRDKIELMETVLLQENLSLGEITEIEDEAEELGVSALIERVGGIATYPSMVPLTASLDDILPTIVHEWMHQYLFFHPLGRHYWASYEMRTINETVADMAGEELGSIVLQEYYDRETKKRNGETPETAFDFNKEMREIRFCKVLQAPRTPILPNLQGQC
jgi:hypothetical protein